MSKDKISDYSSTANSNTDIAAINIDEGCAPSGINNAIRALMAQLKNWQSGAQDVYITPAGSVSAPAVTTNGDTNTGVYFPAADKIALATGGTQAVIVDSSQNVGIGTSSPDRKVMALVSPSSSSDDGYKLSDGTRTSAFVRTGSAYSYRSVGANTAMVYSSNTLSLLADGTSNLTFHNGNGETARIDSSGNVGIGTAPSSWSLSGLSALQIKSGSAYGYGTTEFGLQQNAYYNSGWKYINTGVLASQYGQNNGTHTWMVAPSGTAGNAITFTEAMRIDSSGNLLVGTTSGTAYRTQIVANGTNAALLKTDGVYAVVDHWQASTSGNNPFAQFYTETSATLRGSITYNRAGGLVAYNVTSDYRAKDIIGPVENSGTLIDSVPVYMGKMKGATQERPMFIAHETPDYAHIGEKDAVDADGNPVYQQMDASSLIPVMWAEIQSLRQRVASLEA